MNEGIIVENNGEQNSFFLPKIDGEDEIYQIIRDSKANGDREWKECVENQWKKFQSYANSEFKEKAQLQFFPFWWEMFLGFTFLKNGFQLIKTKIEEPDLHIKFGDKSIWIEATMPERGDGDDEVPDPFLSSGGVARNIPSEKVILRYTNSVFDKNKQYLNRVNVGMCNEDDSYIIAIHSKYLNDSPFNNFIPNIVKAFYPTGNPQVDFSNDELVSEASYSIRQQIIKENEEPIQTFAFFKEGKNDYKGISGVLFSHKTPAQWSSQPPKKDFIFVHNHLAKNPIPLGSFEFATEYFLEEDEKGFTLKPYEEASSQKEHLRFID